MVKWNRNRALELLLPKSWPQVREQRQRTPHVGSNTNMKNNIGGIIAPSEMTRLDQPLDIGIDVSGSTQPLGNDVDGINTNINRPPSPEVKLAAVLRSFDTEMQHAKALTAGIDAQLAGIAPTTMRKTTPEMRKASSSSAKVKKNDSYALAMDDEAVE